MQNLTPKSPEPPAPPQFFCRHWAFQKLCHSLDQRPLSRTCGTMIVGGPGTGKTALCSQIVHNPSDNPRVRPLHSRLLAHHFCQSHDLATLSVPQFILSVATQLAAHSATELPLDREVLSPESLSRDPDEAFKKAVVFPLVEVPAPKETLFLLVDSVDEVEVGTSAATGSVGKGGGRSGAASRTIAELLAGHHHMFPQWLVLVCTARKQSRAVARMFTGFRKISLDDLRKSAVVRDVQQYILCRLDREPSLRQHISRDTAEMLNQLHIKSNGCFLYLARVLDGVLDSFIVLREVREIPGTLNGLYLWLCQRLFNRKQFARAQPLLNCVLAAVRPLDVDRLYSCVSMAAGGMSREDFSKRLHLLRRVLAPAPDGRVLLFHHSFAEWLLDVKHCTKKFLCSTRDGDAMLAAGLTLRARQLTVDEVHELALHLTRLNAVPTCGVTCLDQRTLSVLWLIGCGAPVESSLAQQETSDCQDEAFARVALPTDPRVVSLLVEAGARRGQLEEMVQVEATQPPVVVDPLAEVDVDDDGSGRTVLHRVAADGNAELLQLAIARGADIEAQDRHGQTALNLAARRGHVAVVDLLIAASAVLDHADNDGWTALRAAAWGGHAQVVESLLRGGAAVDSCDSDRRTALRAAAWGGHEEIVVALLEAGADTNMVDEEGRTALIAAAYMGHREIVSHLLARDAQLEHADGDGRTALGVAAMCVPSSEGAAAVVALLLERGAEVDHADRDGMTPLLVAAFEGHRHVCELLLEWDANVDRADCAGRSALWAACSMGHASVVELLLFWGCSVDGIDPEGRTVLSVAAARGALPVVTQLLDRGLDEQHRDNAGWTPLHYAVFEGHATVCAALLEAGARVDTVDNEGKTPLHLAAQEGHARIVSLLLGHDARPGEKAHDGKTPLRLAAVGGHVEIVRSLCAAGADVNAIDADGRSTLYVLALEDRGAAARVLIEEADAEIHTRDSEGRTPLHVSSWQGHEAMVSLLLSSGADVNAIDSESRTALQSAAWQGHDAVVRLLLARGAKPDHTCSQGATALGIAAQEGHECCVLALLQHGADPHQCDRSGRDARRIAERSGHEGVLRLLDERAQAAGGSTSASGSTAETKPSSAPLVAQGYSPAGSPDWSKRRSLVSLGNHSSNSSNLTNSTKSSSVEQQATQGASASFTQRVQQRSKERDDTSPPLSPIAPPPTRPTLLETDPHFARDSHMRIILGSAASAVSRSSSEQFSAGGAKSKRNGIATNPALRIVAGARGNKASCASSTHPWRKETPL